MDRNQLYYAIMSGDVHASEFYAHDRRISVDQYANLTILVLQWEHHLSGIPSNYRSVGNPCAHVPTMKFQKSALFNILRNSMDPN
jgi:hypothetical protein